MQIEGMPHLRDVSEEDRAMPMGEFLEHVEGRIAWSRYLGGAMGFTVLVHTCFESLPILMEMVDLLGKLKIEMVDARQRDDARKDAGGQS